MGGPDATDGHSLVVRIVTPPPRWAVSVKGVVLWEDGVVLVHNERGEWELPGGRLEADEEPKECVVREIAEELGFTAQAETLLDTWVYEVEAGQAVLIVTYGCSAERPARLRLSVEHDDVCVAPVSTLERLKMPEGYRRSIRHWAGLRQGRGLA